MTRRLPRPRGLRGQLILLVLAALVIAQGASLVLFLDERGRALTYATAQDAAGRALGLADALDAVAPKDRAPLLMAAGSRGIHYHIARAPIVSAREARALSQVAARLAGPPAARDLRLAARTDEPWTARDRRHDDDRDEGGADTLMISVALADGDWLNARSRLRRPPPQIATPALVSIGLTALALIAAVWLAVGRIARPMAALADATGRLGRGEKPAPLPLTGPAEIRRVTHAFNDMADRLTRLIEQQARTLGAIGHDLRSPITAMRLRLELVDDDETRERLAICLDEIQTLVEAALALARGDGAGEPLTETDLSGFLSALVTEMQEAGQPVTLTATAPLTVLARPAALKRALRNIAENGVRYGHAARLELARDGAQAVIAIDDDGPGIPPADRSRVFEPFVRLETSRSRDTGGAGLGLAIARVAIEGQGGSIALQDAPGGGTRAIVSLPLA